MKPGLRGVVGREETDGFRAPHCLLRGTLGRATDQFMVSWSRLHWTWCKKNKWSSRSDGKTSWPLVDEIRIKSTRLVPSGSESFHSFICYWCCLDLGQRDSVRTLHAGSWYKYLNTRSHSASDASGCSVAQTFYFTVGDLKQFSSSSVPHIAIARGRAERRLTCSCCL